MKSSNTGLIADIQRCSIHDGPGIRTTVFVKGCPLSCVWCHNPECISPEPQKLFYPEKCIGCGFCAEGCYTGARVTCGRKMTPEEVFREIELDRPYYGADGGLTISGGEPLMQADFCVSLLDLCAEHGIHRAVETSLYIWNPQVMTRIELLMADLKIWDDDAHRKYTGVGNEMIKRHFRLADELDIPIILRTPVVPGVTDDPENIRAIAEFACSLKNIVKYELLPYHPLGEGKRAALGLPESTFSIPSPDHIKELNRIADIR